MVPWNGANFSVQREKLGPEKASMLILKDVLMLSKGLNFRNHQQILYQRACANGRHKETSLCSHH
jgi:hypothetical protein